MIVLMLTDASKAPGVPVYIEVPEPPWFYDGVLLVYKVA
jgi:hypothetical protein